MSQTNEMDQTQPPPPSSSIDKQTTCSSSGSSSAFSSKIMLSSDEGTVIHVDGQTSDMDSGSINDNQNKNPQTSSSRDLIFQYVDDLQLKSTLYEKELESIENIDFNLAGLLNSKNSNDDDDDDNVYVSKLIGKAKESLDQMTILLTPQFKHLNKKFDYTEECMTEIINIMEQKIHHFKHMDQE